ncbi:serine/threonine protein kinase [Nonomuraea sp. WAC 01424]|uniref:serine/threonine protein kinase n=1 Tax=Nonomuraea sp. WAC 01424 TaxID=2203200 RepID=UPI000F7A84E0|nr:serine/threonine-protein kinase [Nonomuraea sp. WAC 01424]RSN05013.1 serine/threonine protein kinase [Nonomuraea sp. WAC 01424]
MPNVEPLREGDPAAVGPYRLAGRLGAGGHGVVYLARGRDGGPVAVKVLAEGVTAGEAFAREIAAARGVEPSCVAQVLDASARGRPYIVTEYVDGRSLQEAGGPRGGAELQRLAVATATALAAVHQAGVVHRDFKPANVRRGPGGPRVTDFGMSAAFGAGVTATGTITGTPAYMAPEQLSGRRAGTPADVFAWASVIVFAATGVPPFGDDSLPAVINRILHDEPRTGDLPQPLLDAVLDCLAKDPERRPAMRDVLLRLLGGPPAAAPRAASYETPAVVRPPAIPGMRLVAGGPPAMPAPLPERPDPQPAAPHDFGPPPPRLHPDGPHLPEPHFTEPGVPEPHLTDSRLSEADTLGEAEPQEHVPEPAGPGARRPGRVRRRVKTAMVAGVSGVSVLVLAGAIVWLTPSTPTPTAGDAADAAGAPATTGAASPTSRPRRTRTSGPEPQSESTPSPLPDLLTLGSLRPSGGTRNGDCWDGAVRLQAAVARTGDPVTLQYAWIIDGAVTTRSSATVTENGRRYLTSPSTLTSSGPHTVTLRITAPVTRQRTIEVTLCDDTPL